MQQLFHRPPFSIARTLCALLPGLLFSAAAVADVTPLTSMQCKVMQERKVISADNPVPCARLAQVSFRYLDFRGKLHHDGRVVVLDVVAPQVQGILDELLARKFPLQMAQPLEAYQGDDEASMRDNNTSAFNGRPMTGSSSWSKHAYGVAIDINPLQNPYIGKDANQKTVVLPPAADPGYLTRRQRPGMAEAVTDIFFRHGFLIWGGYWKQPIDYQHFEIGSRDFIAHLLTLPPDAARTEFQSYADTYTACLSNSVASDIPALPTRRKACAGKTKR